MSICSLSAICLALPIGRTLNPTTMASEAEANKTSLSVMAPTAL